MIDKNKTEIQRSLQRALSWIQENPYLAEQIILQGKNKKRIREKLSAVVKVISSVVVCFIAGTIAAGYAIQGKPWGLLNWIMESRQTLPAQQLLAINQNVFPEYDITNESMTDSLEENEKSDAYYGSVQMSMANVSVREAVTDGYGIYLSVAAQPVSDDILILNYSINPFSASPEEIGCTPEHEGQTIAAWAVAHGYKEIIRMSLTSPRSVPYTNGRLLATQEFDPATNRNHVVKIDSFQNDRVSSGANFDSLRNAKMILEEDHTSLIMAAGGYTDQDAYELSCFLVPWRMTQEGKEDPLVPDVPYRDELEPLMDFDFSDRAQLTFVPARIDQQEMMLGEYGGATYYMESPTDRTEIHVKFVRTQMNDYYIVQCGDTGRIYEGVTVYCDAEKKEELKPAKAFVSRYLLKDDTIEVVQSSMVPDVLPSHLYIHWEDGTNELFQDDVVTKQIRQVETQNEGG